MEEINIGELLGFIKSKLMMIFTIVIFFVLAGTIYSTLVKKPMYESNTTIILVNKSGQQYSQTDATLNRNLISTYSEIVKSRKVLSAVIENLNLNTSTGALAGHITVSSVTNTDIIKISVTDLSATNAASIANEIAKVFGEEIKEMYHLENITTIDQAEANKTPYNIHLVKDDMLYLAVGLVVAFAIVICLYYFDTTIKSEDDIVNKLDLTVLGSVPVER